MDVLTVLAGVITVGGSLVGLVVWSVRLEGRVNTHELRHRQHDKSHDEIKADVQYIRARIDAALNGRGKHE
jgi:hypothetical protein